MPGACSRSRTTCSARRASPTGAARSTAGQLITFNQFLREKNFIRTPVARRARAARATVKQIACSQCGAPIDLANDNACPHCGAAVALIDPDGVAKALHDLAAGAAPIAPPMPPATSAALSDAQIDAIFDVARLRESEGTSDLVAIGAAAIGGIVGALIASRFDETRTPRARQIDGSAKSRAAS